jgi:1-phosphofructokinase
MEKLHRMGKKVLFDSSKAALSAGIDSHPWLIKPNDEELSDFIGKHLSTPEACQSAAQTLSNKGIDNIVVSMGSEGVMWLSQTDDSNATWLRSQPPKMEVVSTVGAGDTLVAGLCWGHMQQMEPKKLLRFATALSALAVSQVGVGLTSQEELERIELATEVSELAPITNIDMPF